MKNDVTSKKAFDSSGLISYLIKWYKPITIVCVAAVVLSAVFSSPFFITPKYKSTVVMFPTASNALSRALLSERTGGRQDILEFGEQEQAEQLLQILNSSEIRDRVMKEHNLMEHYGIDTSSRHIMSRFVREYRKNIRFKRTEFMAVEITVMDKDPQKAADVANDIAALLDTVKNRMQKERAIQGYNIVKKEFARLQSEIQHMEDSLTALRKLGVHDYERQAQVISEQLAIAIAENNRRGAAALQEKLDVLAMYGGAYVSLRDALEHEKKQLSAIKARYDEAKVDAEQELPHKFIVDRAYKADRKSYPIRWLIVVISTLLTAFLAVLAIVIIENINRFRQDFKAQQYK